MQSGVFVNRIRCIIARRGEQNPNFLTIALFSKICAYVGYKLLHVSNLLTES